MDKIESGCPPKFFSKTKNMHIDHENPGTAPVPGPKIFFTTIFTLKNTLSPDTGAVPGFY